ncbi:hypothetical protein KXD40_005159 [Peronospora effusa]|nr:hypothetical protein KXD40_005159 [Peronospora effusa]
MRKMTKSRWTRTLMTNYWNSWLADEMVKQTLLGTVQEALVYIVYVTFLRMESVDSLRQEISSDAAAI